MGSPGQLEEWTDRQTPMWLELCGPVGRWYVMGAVERSRCIHSAKGVLYSDLTPCVLGGALRTLRGETIVEETVVRRLLQTRVVGLDQNTDTGEAKGQAHWNVLEIKQGV